MDPNTKTPVRLDVIDTGIGIPDDKLEKVFQAFQQQHSTTERKYGGTGLGLTISQSLCELLGYPERFAQEALGHNSKAVHRAYAKRAKMQIASLEDYERKGS
jgi:signal transduction histidine kinase